MFGMGRIMFAVAVAAIAICGVAACGSSKDSAPVARVGNTPITTTEVDHWMKTLAGGDYYELSHKHVIPQGLVSLPADYSRCEANLKAAVDSSPLAAVIKRKLAPNEYEVKCHDLHEALRLQATAYLVQANWMKAIDREIGVSASEAEVEELFKQIKASQFPSEAAQQKFLQEHRESLADLLLVVRLDVYRRKNDKILTEEKKPVVLKLVNAENKWTKLTTCAAGYVVVNCKEYATKPSTAPKPASVLMEQLTAMVTGLCVNYAACAKP